MQVSGPLRVFQALNLWNDWNGLNVWNRILLRVLHTNGKHPLQVMP
jgi:hypothetical protein